MNVDFAITSPTDWAKKSLNSRNQNIISPVIGDWATQRTVWARIISGADTPDVDRISNILWMGKSRGSTYENSYESIINNRPTFGLDSIKVDFKGTMGSTKSCTISFKCWTLEQLQILEKLYMVPGISVIAEWGWSLTNTGERVLPNDEFLTLPKQKDPYSAVMKSIIAKRENYGGNYDGLIGLITNFNYSLNENLGFDCQVEIVAPGEMWLEQNATTTSKGCGDDNNNKQEKQSNLQFAFHDLHKNYSDKNKLELINKIYDDRARVAIIQEWETETREYDKNHRSTADAIRQDVNEAVGNTALGNPEVYISWQYFVVLLNENIGLFNGKTNVGGKKVNMGGKVELAMDLIPVTVLPKFYSLDPTVCTFKPINVDVNNGWNREREIIFAHDQKFKIDANGKEVEIQPTKWETLKTSISTAWNSGMTALDNILENIQGPGNTKIREHFPENSLPDINGDNALNFAKIQIDEIGNNKDKESLIENKDFVLDDNVGLLNCIFLNTGFLRDCVTISSGDHLTIQDYLTKVLGDLNIATGNLWNLQYHVDEKDNNRIRIYDANYTSNNSRKNQIKPYEFRLLENETLLLRGATVESKLVDGFKSMVLYGNNTKDNGNNDNANQGMQLYSNKISDFWREADKKDDTEQNLDKCINSEGEIIRPGLTLNPEADMDYNYKLLLDAADADTIAGAKNAMQQYIAWINTDEKNKELAKNLPMNQNILLPFNFSLSIDGFSGLVWGNAINFDYLPTRYNDRIYFQITKISHDISVSDWSTTIETIMRLKPDERTSSTTLSAASTATLDEAGKQLIREQAPNGPVQSKTTYGAESTGTNTAEKAAMYSGISKNQIDPNDPRNKQDISGFFTNNRQ